LPGKDWAVWVFSPAQHTYRDGAWDGPAIVLTDGDTASAAEQFAAVLQDNRAAIVLGARTAGAGCGHSWGGTPTKLKNSGATLRVPDCVRHRADGSNEVRGILPEVAIPWRANDGTAFRARLLEAALPEAARRAKALHAQAR
jgi:C-terminal processing protease CtpA/Prc